MNANKFTFSHTSYHNQMQDIHEDSKTLINKFYQRLNS